MVSIFHPHFSMLIATPFKSCWPCDLLWLMEWSRNDDTAIWSQTVRGLMWWSFLYFGFLPLPWEKKKQAGTWETIWCEVDSCQERPFKQGSSQPIHQLSESTWIKPSQCQPSLVHISRPTQRYHRPVSDNKMVALIHYMWGSFVSKQLLADTRDVLHQNYIEDQASPSSYKDSLKHYRNTLETCANYL